MQLKNHTGRLAKWIIKLQTFEFAIEYVKGSANVRADALSRLEINCARVEEGP